MAGDADEQREVIAHERSRDADQRARHQQAIGTGDLARQPARAGDAIEQQPGRNADDEQKQEDGPRG